MTTLTPRRDAIVAAAAKAREDAKAFPVPENRINAINLEMMFAVIEASVIPVAEVIDLSGNANLASAMLANAYASAIVSFAESHANGNKMDAQRFAQEFLAALIDRTRSAFDQAPIISAIGEFSEVAQGRAQ